MTSDKEPPGLVFWFSQIVYVLSDKTLSITDIWGTCLVVQWLSLCTPNAGGPGSIPGQGTRPHVKQIRVCMPQLRLVQSNKEIKIKKYVFKAMQFPVLETKNLLSFLLLLQCYLLQTLQFKTTQNHSLTVLEVRSSKIKVSTSVHSFLGLHGRIHFLVSPVFRGIFLPLSKPATLHFSDRSSLDTSPFDFPFF